MSETQTVDDNHVVSIDEYRHLTLQDLLREWAESARGPDWCPAGEDEAANWPTSWRQPPPRSMAPSSWTASSGCGASCHAGRAPDGE